MRSLLLFALLLLAACSEQPEEKEDSQQEQLVVPQQVNPTSTDSPEAAAALFCKCNKNVYEKYTAKMKDMMANATEVPKGGEARAYQNANRIWENMETEKQSCRELLADFGKKVEKNPKLGLAFRDASQPCMADIDKQYFGQLKTYTEYIDKLGKKQHEALKEIGKKLE